jgi:hypothetical protein
VQRAGGGDLSVRDDPRLVQLREALQVLLGNVPNRAEQVQMLLSDRSPPPR